MRLLITGAWSGANFFFSFLEKHGYTIEYMQQEKDDIPCDPSCIQGVVCNNLFLYHDIERFTKIEFVQLTSVGIDRIPYDYIMKNGITLFNAHGVYSIPMAEHVLSVTLDFFRNSYVFFVNLKNKVWRKERNLRELYSSVVCIIGCGSVGKECARRFKAFGCDVIGVDVISIDSDLFSKVYTFQDMNEAIKRADVVVLSLPLSIETMGIVDESFLKQLKSGCVLINISRGKIVQTEALLKSLFEKDIYAALDVFEEEPLSSDSPLWDMKNVIITPHNSFIGNYNNQRLAEVILSNLVGEIDAKDFINSNSTKSHLSIS